MRACDVKLVKYWLLTSSGVRRDWRTFSVIENHNTMSSSNLQGTLAVFMAPLVNCFVCQRSTNM